MNKRRTKPISKRIETCRRKIKYLCPILAMQRYIEIAGQGGSDNLQIYTCEFCGGLHLGNRELTPYGEKRINKLSRAIIIKLITRLPQNPARPQE